MEHNLKKYKSIENQHKYKMLENVFEEYIRCILRLSSIKYMEYPTYMHNTSQPPPPKKHPFITYDSYLYQELTPLGLETTCAHLIPP